MKVEAKNHLEKNNSESGAALVTVLMITILLGIACVALLSSVGANSRNSTDVLSETKAYYAAESGLQATINVLRNTSGITYSNAIADSDLSTWLTYNCTASNTVSVGDNACLNNGTSYRINVSDPDNTADSLQFSTSGSFLNSNVATVSYPSTSAIDKVSLSFVPVANCLITFTSNTNCNNTTNPLLGSLRIENVGNGAQITDTVKFQINYTASIGPRQGTRTIRGTITQSSPTANILVTFNPNSYTIMGSDIKICENSTTSTPCPAFTLSIPPPASNSFSTTPIYMTTTPAEPYRLKVESIGYGPNGSRKLLEGIIQKNFFNGLAGPSTITMQGTGSGLVFNPGNSSVFEITGQDGTSGVTVPSIGVVDQQGLTNVLNGIPNNNNNIIPAPAVITDIPDWMSTPQNLDAVVSQLRTTAQQSGRYFLNSNPNSSMNINSVGDYVTGTGITFCEGNCDARVNGGGVLVVTGQLKNVGGWSFKGLIIVTGTEGWDRRGGGGGVISGNVVIAPYTSAQLASNTFSLPPKYTVTGSGTSEIEYDGVSLEGALDNTSSISDFMLGVAEK